MADVAKDLDAPGTPRLLLALAAVYLVWGSTYLAIRFAVETLPPFLMAGVRFVVAGVLLYGWLRGTGAARRPAGSDWRMAAIAGGLMLVGGNGLLSWAQQSVPSGLAALLVGTVPIWLVLFARLGPEREVPNLLEMTGVMTGLGGVVILVAGSGESLRIPGASAVEALTGAMAVLAASVFWAAGSMYSRRARPRHSGLFTTAMIMLAGGALLLAVGAAVGELGRVDPAAMTTRSLLALAYLVVFGSVVAFSAYTWLLRAVRPALAGTYAYVNPVVAVLLGWALADERITPAMIVGTVMILTAVLLAQRGRQRARRRARSGAA